MQISLLVQLGDFFMSFSLGLVLGVFYDLFRVANLFSKPTHRRIFIQDVFYFVISGIVTFLFMLVVNSGEIRFYIIAGEVAGFLLYHFTFGRLVVSFMIKIYRLLVRLRKRACALEPACFKVLRLRLKSLDIERICSAISALAQKKYKT